MEDAAAIYTLNLVDRTLLCDDEHGEIALAAEGDPEPDPEPFAPVDGTETVLAEKAQTRCTEAADAAVLAEIAEDEALAERRRLATVPPDPEARHAPRALQHPADVSTASTVWNPLAADEWAYLEAGAPCIYRGSASTSCLIAERADNCVEFLSASEDADDEAEGDRDPQAGVDSDLEPAPFAEKGDHMKSERSIGTTVGEMSLRAALARWHLPDAST